METVLSLDLNVDDASYSIYSLPQDQMQSWLEGVASLHYLDSINWKVKLLAKKKSFSDKERAYS